MRKEARLGDSVSHGVRSKACEKRGGAWRQCHVVSERRLVQKEAGLRDSTTWCQTESL